MTTDSAHLNEDGHPESRGPSSRQLSSLDLLARQWFGFDFFQAVRLLEIAAQSATSASAAGSGNPVGKDFAPGSEGIRFRVAASQRFPGSAIMAYVPDRKGTDGGPSRVPAEMTVSFLGLTGPSGVLPQHYTQRLIDQLREDAGMSQFFDIFNHRIISHFYRAWKKYRFAISYETESRTGQTTDEHEPGDVFTCGMYGLVGLGTGGLRRRQEIPDEARLYYAGQFAHHPRTAVSLERMIVDYFGWPTEVIQFLGQWLVLSPADQTRVSSDGEAGDGNNQLGVTAIAGERVWGIENKFRLQLGPLSYSEFWELTPGGGQLSPLSQFVRTYVGPDFDFDVQLVLRREEVPACQLARDGAIRPHLGWNSWLRSSPMKCDAEDAVFQVEGGPTR